jgi:hypothetical protein
MLLPDDAPSEYVSFAAAEREHLDSLPADTLKSVSARLGC